MSELITNGSRPLSQEDEGINSSETGQRRAVERFNSAEVEKGPRRLTPEEEAEARRYLWRLWKAGLDYFLATPTPVLNDPKTADLVVRKASRKAFLRALKRGQGTLKHSCWAADDPESQFYRSDVPVLADGKGLEIFWIPQYAFRTSRGLAMGLWFPERHKPRTKAEKEKARRSEEIWQALQEENQKPGVSMEEQIAAIEARHAAEDKAKAEETRKKAEARKGTEPVEVTTVGPYHFEQIRKRKPGRKPKAAKG